MRECTKSVADMMADAIEEAVREGRPVSWLAKARVGLDDVIRAVAAYYDLTPAELIANRSQTQEPVRRRRVAMVLARQLTRASYPRIAKLWGMDHTTVLHNVRTYFARPTDPLRHDLQAVKNALTANPNTATQAQS